MNGSDAVTDCDRIRKHLGLLSLYPQLYFNTGYFEIKKLISNFS